MNLTKPFNLSRQRLNDAVDHKNEMQCTRAKLYSNFSSKLISAHAGVTVLMHFSYAYETNLYPNNRVLNLYF